MAGNYNRNTYNSALYNAGRTDAGATIRSIISAHTGPHIQAIVGGDPTGSPEAGDGLSFISDFSIVEGSVFARKPPAGYFFPDLAARIDAVRSQIDNLAAYLRAQPARDLPASIYLVAYQPDLPASLFGLAQKDLSAFLFGELAKKDLPASIFVAVDNLAGKILGIPAPRLRGKIFVNPPGNLGAIIWSPTDLKATIQIVKFQDLPASILGFGFKDLSANMLGFAAPQLFAFLRGFASQTSDLPGDIRLSASDPNLPATIVPSFGGETGFRVGLEAQISSAGNYSDFFAAITSSISTFSDLTALIKTGGDYDLAAVISFLGADNLKGLIVPSAFADTAADIIAFLRPVRTASMGASMEINSNARLLPASIVALRDRADLGAFIRVAETFVTAIYNIITFSSRNLRATIGNPDCEGGSASAVLSAYANAQSASNLQATVQSFIENNLGAVINNGTIFRTMDHIDVSYRKYRPHTKKFIVSDTISVTYSPFRGATLPASIVATPPEAILPATITATFLPPRVAPSVSVLTNADLRFGEELNIQQIRLQLEGSLLSYFYVNNTQDAFIQDPNEQWRLNIRSFQPIAENLFGDFAAARVCRLGSLESFSTIDEAVRFCISAVIGLEGQRDFGATLVARGGINSLSAVVGISDVFEDLGAIVNRVFPMDFPATISGVPIGQYGLPAILYTTTPANTGLPAYISGYGQLDMLASISGVP